MTAPRAVEINAGDHRRALALLLHWQSSDHVGITTVLKEANDADRRIQLVLGVLSCVTQLVPQLSSPGNLFHLQQQVTHALHEEHEEQQ